MMPHLARLSTLAIASFLAVSCAQQNDLVVTGVRPATGPSYSFAGMDVICTARFAGAERSLATTLEGELNANDVIKSFSIDDETIAVSEQETSIGYNEKLSASTREHQVYGVFVFPYEGERYKAYVQFFVSGDSLARKKIDQTSSFENPQISIYDGGGLQLTEYGATLKPGAKPVTEGPCSIVHPIRQQS